MKSNIISQNQSKKIDCPSPVLLSLKVHPKSKQEKIVERGDHAFEIWVRSAPEDGKANRAVIEMLSRYLKRPQSSFVLKSGIHSKHKVIECR